MGEDYYSMNREELIERLKIKDGQITDLKEKYNCLKADTAKEIDKAQNMRAEAFAKLKQENEEYKKSYYNSELSGLKAENELFRDTIVAMATYTYPGISNFDKIFRHINHSLEMITKGR